MSALSVSTDDRVVSLDVGGTQFTSSATTLAVSSGYFERLLSRRWAAGGSKSIFLDRDPEPFAVLLSYMRSHLVALPDDVSFCRRVLVEAEFLAMERYITIIKAVAHRNEQPDPRWIGSDAEAAASFDARHGGLIPAIESGVLPARFLEPIGRARLPQTGGWVATEGPAAQVRQLLPAPPGTQVEFGPPCSWQYRLSCWHASTRAVWTAGLRHGLQATWQVPQLVSCPLPAPGLRRDALCLALVECPGTSTRSLDAFVPGAALEPPLLASVHAHLHRVPWRIVHSGPALRPRHLVALAALGLLALLLAASGRDLPPRAARLPWHRLGRFPPRRAAACHLPGLADPKPKPPPARARARIAGRSPPPPAPKWIKRAEHPLVTRWIG